MRVDILQVGELEVNCYILSSEKTKNAILVDPGDDYPKIKSFLEKQKLSPRFILHTHGHFDHIGADNEFGLPVYAHRLDAELLRSPKKNLSDFFSSSFQVNAQTHILEDKEIVRLDELSLEVIHTPGHTPGGICLKSGNVIFTGDTLFAGGIGRTDFPGASEERLIQSIEERLMVFPDETLIYPGHGPSSTIGRERKRNPFLCKS